MNFDKKIQIFALYYHMSRCFRKKMVRRLKNFRLLEIARKIPVEVLEKFKVKNVRGTKGEWNDIQTIIRRRFMTENG